MICNDVNLYIFTINIELYVYHSGVDHIWNFEYGGAHIHVWYAHESSLMKI